MPTSSDDEIIEIAKNAVRDDSGILSFNIVSIYCKFDPNDAFWKILLETDSGFPSIIILHVDDITHQVTFIPTL